MNQVLLFGGVAAVLAAGAVAYVSLTPPPSPKGAAVALGPAVAAPAKPAETKSAGSHPTPVAVTPAPAPAPAPAQPPAPGGPRFDIVRVAPDGAAVIAGRATPGSSVTVRDGEQPLGSVEADGRGEWVLLPDQPLTPGTRELNLSEQKPGIAEPVPSERVVVVMVPEPAPAAGGASSEAPSPPLAAPLAVAVPRDGLGPSTVLQAPTVLAPGGLKEAAPKQAAPVTRSIAAPPPPGGVSVESMDYNAAGQVAMGGRAQPGSAVQLYLDNLLVGRAHTDPDGRWRLSPERAISPGVYTLRADQVTDAGKVTARVELPVQVSEVPANLPEGRKVVVQPGNSLWRIARTTYGHGVQYTQIYQANRDQIRDPDLIYPGQIFALPVAN